MDQNGVLSASVIITTYNWPEALAVTLKSLLRQSSVPEESQSHFQLKILEWHDFLMLPP